MPSSKFRHQGAEQASVSRPIEAKMESYGGWWAVHTRHHHEQSVSEMLCAKGFEVFLAAYQVRRRWKDRPKSLLVPLFPCYVFVRERSGAKLQVISTPGVHNILTQG